MSKISAKDSLLAAASSLFAEKGYRDVSTREIADVAGVNLGAISYYFGSKAQLFVETVRRMTALSGRATADESLKKEIKGPNEAAVALYQFIHSIMEYLLRPVGPSPCRLMCREIYSDTANDSELFEALVSSVVKDYTAPSDQALQRVLGILLPDCRKRELQRYSESIFGQCAFYLTHRPFIERLRGVDLSKDSSFEDVVEHIFCFSLRGAGCSIQLIRSAAQTAQRGLRTRGVKTKKVVNC